MPKTPPPEKKQETMGDRIRMRREALGMTQLDLAGICGVAKATVSSWETGYAENIRLPTFLRLLTALRIKKPEYLIWGVEGSPPAVEPPPASAAKKRPPPTS
jgi:transcriptional regulator with XRE-family HTH domain